MKFKSLLVLSISFLVLIFGLTAQQTSKVKKEKEFLKTCNAIAYAYLKRDIKKMNSFIHPKTGIYLLYQPSQLYGYLHFDKLNTKYSVEEDRVIADTYPKDLEFYFPDTNSVQKLKSIKFDSQIEFDCDSGWNKYGSFVDSFHTPSRFSIIIKSHIAEYENYYPENNAEIKSSKKDLVKVKAIEKKSRLVVFNEFKPKELIFYLTLINNKWYLTVLDFITYCEPY